jgi:hypothetical protein
MSTPTESTESPTPTIEITHLAALAAVLESAPAEVFAVLANEALTLSERATSQQLCEFWLDQYETFDYQAKRVSALRSGVAA